MSDQVEKPRQSVNLDEFERRLRGPERVKSHNEDPLAELARLVDGGHDPFYGSVAQSSRAPRPVAPPVAVPEPATHNEYAQSHPTYAIEPESLQASGLAHDGDWRQPQGVAHNSPQVQPHMHADFPQDSAGVYTDAPRVHAMADGQGEPLAQDYGWQGEPVPPAEPYRRSRTGLFAMVGATAVVVLGIGTTFALKGGPAGGKDAPVIKAATGPTKIQPEAASTAAPAQSASVLEKTTDKLATSRIVNSVEQPIDTSASRLPKPPVRDAGSSLFPEARRVKTVSVRPDGSIIGGDIAVATTPPVTAPAPPARPQAAIIPPAARAATVSPTTTPAIAASKSVTAPATPKATVRVAARTDDPDDAAPAKAAAKPVSKPVAKPAIDRKPAGGGFAVQLGTASSDAEAREKASRYARQYGSNLAGRSASILKGESNGQKIWRVRIVGLSQESATAMCGKVKGSGGDCFVAR